MKNVNYHQLLNTFLLGILAFIGSKFYDIGDRLVDKVNAHEVTLAHHEDRITELEKAKESRQDNKQTSMLHWDAILPDCKVKVKQE
jgi:hypothetical protein